MDRFSSQGLSDPACKKLRPDGANLELVIPNALSDVTNVAGSKCQLCARSVPVTGTPPPPGTVKL
jgi:hypothetical protein